MPAPALACPPHPSTPSHPLRSHAAVNTSRLCRRLEKLPVLSRDRTKRESRHLSHSEFCQEPGHSGFTMLCILTRLYRYNVTHWAEFTHYVSKDTGEASIKGFLAEMSLKDEFRVQRGCVVNQNHHVVLNLAKQCHFVDPLQCVQCVCCECLS